MINYKYVLNESIQGTVGDFCDLKGIDEDKFVEFLQANFDWARHCESYTMVDFDCLERCLSKLNESAPPKWKQKVLNDENTLLDHFSIDDFDEAFEGFSYEDFLDEVHAVNTYGFDEKIEKLVALSLWKDLTGDYDKSYELEQRLYKEVCDEYQEKYGRKRKPQSYIKDPTDASEIFDKMALI